MGLVKTLLPGYTTSDYGCVRLSWKSVLLGSKVSSRVELLRKPCVLLKPLPILYLSPLLLLQLRLLFTMDVVPVAFWYQMAIS
jgi:hypothetical protein